MNNMSYKIVEHTADLRLKVSSPTLEDLFRDAAFGMMRVLKTDLEDYLDEKPTIKRELELGANNTTVLLVDFLNEILTLAETNEEIYTKISFKEIDENSIYAILEGIKIDEFDEDIKAVTYHEVDIKRNKLGELETILIFDI